MKAFRFLGVVLLLGGILLSACTAAPAPASQNVTSAGSDKPISEVVFTGTIESMNGSQWVINGQTITVDSSTMQDGSFLVGDTVKVEAQVAADGAVTAKSVESPSADDLADAATSTPEPAATETSVIDDNSNEAVGAVEAIDDTSITIAGQTYTFAPGAEIKGTIGVGTIVKLHFVTNADGTLSVSEVEMANPTEAGNDNGSDDNSNGTNANDNSSNNNSSNDNSSDDNSNVNSNDDDQDDDNGNANDDNGNDDNGGSGNDNSNDSSSIG
jgi:hypothetical protein